MQRAVAPSFSPVLHFEAVQFPESTDSAAARQKRGPVPPAQILLRDTVMVPEGGMDVQGELVARPPDTLELVLHVGRAHGGVIKMVTPVPYEASIANLLPGRYLLRRTVILHLFTGNTRRIQVVPDSLVTIQ